MPCTVRCRAVPAGLLGVYVCPGDGYVAATFMWVVCICLRSRINLHRLYRLQLGGAHAMVIAERFFVMLGIASEEGNVIADAVVQSHRADWISSFFLVTGCPKPSPCNTANARKRISTRQSLPDRFPAKSLKTKDRPKLYPSTLWPFRAVFAQFQCNRQKNAGRNLEQMEVMEQRAR